MTAPQDDTEHVSFLNRRVPCSFDARVVVLPPGARRVYYPADWQDTLVVIEHGELELECGNTRVYFRRGDVLHLGTLPVHTLRSCGSEHLTLAAVTRRTNLKLNSNLNCR